MYVFYRNFALCITYNANVSDAHVYRYDEYAEDAGGAPNRVIPHPLSIDLQWNTPVQTDNSWTIVSVEADTGNEADYFAGKLLM